MTYNWSSQFEGYPTDSDFGSVMGQTIRDTKAAFKERLEVEHNVDETASAVVTHKVGECTIVKIYDEDTPVSLLVDGAVSAKDGVLYRDNGSSVEKMGIGSHLNMGGTGDDDHTQYFKNNGVDTIEGNFDVPDIVDLDVSESPADNQVLSKSHETQDSASGGARHAAGSVSSDITSLGLDLIKHSDGQITITQQIDTGDNYELTLEEYSSWLTIVQAKQSDGTTEHSNAFMSLYCITTSHDDYVGRVGIAAGWGVGTRLYYPNIIIGFKYLTN